MIVKIELIVLSIIAILSFVTGIVINLIDVYRGKEIEKDNKHPVEDEYTDDVKKKIEKDNPDLDDKTIVDINIPKTEDEDVDSSPVIVEVLDFDDDDKK